MINCAIVGCGRIAGDYDTPASKKVRTHAKAFQDNENCQLAGVCDIDIDRARKFGDTWNCPIVTDDVSELIEKSRPDLLSICSSTESHRSIFELACNLGVSRIWLEKPAALSLDDVIYMKELAQENNVEVWVNYFRRYDKGFKKVKQEITELGKIQQVQAFYTKGLRHNGSHLIDLIHWLFGKITGYTHHKILPDHDFPSLSGIVDVDGLQIHLAALDYHCYELFEVDIIGSNGRIKIIDGGQKIIFETVVESKYYPDYKNLDICNIHDSSYGTFMRAGLQQGLAGEDMPSLQDETDLLQSLELCFNASLEVRDGIN